MYIRRHFRLPLLAISAFGIVGGLLYYQTSHEAAEYASASYLTNGNLVGIYAQRGQYQKALNVIDALQKEHPEDPAIYYNAALIYKSLKDTTAAINVLEAGMPFATDPVIRQQFLDLLSQLAR